MKFTVDVDCTPEEARSFLGLPDVVPMQQAMMNEIQKSMADNLKAMDPDQMMKMWMPSGMQGFEHMQKMFMNQMGMGNTKKSDE